MNSEDISTNGEDIPKDEKGSSIDGEDSSRDHKDPLRPVEGGHEQRRHLYERKRHSKE